MAQISEPSYLFLGTLWNEAFQRSLGGTGHLPDILIRHPPPEGPPAGPGSLASANLGPTPFWSVYRALGAVSEGAEGSPGDQVSCGPCAHAGAHWVPQAWKEPQGTCQGSEPPSGPCTALYALPSGLGPLGRSSWECQRSAKRFWGARTSGAPTWPCICSQQGGGRLESRPLSSPPLHL